MQNTDYLINYYNEYDEEGRLLNNRLGRVEYLTTRRYLDPLLTTDGKIAEIGAGTGRYSVTLAKEGYDVTAVELVQHNLDILKSKLDGASRYIREYLEEMDDDTFDKWLSYHFATCERQDLIGATNHALDILRKV